jgi:hypothetical protein
MQEDNLGLIAIARIVIELSFGDGVAKPNPITFVRNDEAVGFIERQMGRGPM